MFIKSKISISMTKLKLIFALLVILIFFNLLSCKSTDSKAPVLHPSEIQTVIRQMTDIMIHDITNPPLAARFFSYTCLAGYEVVAQNDSTFRSMKGVLNEFSTIEKPNISNYSYQLAAILAMLETAKKMQPSGKIADAVVLIRFSIFQNLLTNILSIFQRIVYHFLRKTNI